MLKYTPENITQLKSHEVFVFGSNLLGVHGAGAAKAAKNFGAKIGFGIGHIGQTYAIPTKDQHIKTLPLTEIEKYVQQFYLYVLENQQFTFLITKIGCGLAGYSPKEIAPMFAPFINLPNCRLPKEFADVIQNTHDC